MTISELAAEIVANADNLNGEPLNATDALVRKMAQIADQDAVAATGLNLIRDERFTHEEKAICTPALMERAERLRQEQTSATMEKAKKKSADSYPITHRDGKYWIDNTAANDPTLTEMGPYDTKKEAEEDRKGLLRSAKLKPSEITTDHDDRAKAKAAGKTKKGKKSEPSPAKPGHDDSTEAQADVAQGENTTPSESESDMKTDSPTKSKKKAKGTSAKATGKASTKAASKAAKAPKGEKKATAPKAAKPAKEKKVGCLDAAHQVLKGRSNPLSPQELIDIMAERKLWSSPGGKTPAQTLRAALDREIKNKGKDSRFAKPEAGKFSAA